MKLKNIMFKGNILCMWNVKLGKRRTQVNELFLEIDIFEAVVEVGTQMTYAVDRVKIV